MPSNLAHGRGTPLWRYFLHGPGSAWRTAPTPWRALRAMLLKHVGKDGLRADQVPGLTTNFYVAAFGHGPGKGKK